MPFPSTEARGSLSELITQGIVVADRLPMPTPVPNVPGYKDIETHGTTVIAVKYKDGLINVADRRATAGLYDHVRPGRKKYWRSTIIR